MRVTKLQLLGRERALTVAPVTPGAFKLAGSAFFTQLGFEVGGDIYKRLQLEEWSPPGGAQTYFPAFRRQAGGVLVAGFDPGLVQLHREMALRALGQAGTAATRAHRCDLTEYYIDDLGLKPLDVGLIVQGAAEANFDFLAYKKDPKPLRVLEEIGFMGCEIPQDEVERALAIAEGEAHARELILHPPNVVYPEELGRRAKAILEPLGLKVRVYDHNEVAAMGYGLLTAVGKGSARREVLIEIVYEPEGCIKTECLALVGKGLTMDTGGYYAKPFPTANSMKGDMAGAAAVIGAMYAIAKLKLQRKVVAVIPAAENSISGSAMYPGDIYTSADGLHIEITHPDAEGRLVLGDAITHARRALGATQVIDIATLTGAAVVVTGSKRAVVFGTSDMDTRNLIAAGIQSAEPWWRMPLDKWYSDDFKSGAADMGNVATASPSPGSCHGALFLSRFAGDTRWMHLDIAGPALVGMEKGDVPGFGVGTLTRYVMAL